MSDGPRCFLCGRQTYDPDKREQPWARGVQHGHQLLVCPACQRSHADWSGSLDRCPACDSTRLSLTLGEVICRACGHVSAPA